MSKNVKAHEMLSQAATRSTTIAEDNSFKRLLIKVPNKLYIQTIKKQSQMRIEAANKGDTSNISIHSVVLNAMREFMKDEL